MSVMLELRARAHDMAAAIARFEDSLKQVLPVGQAVRCEGFWAGKVACYMAFPDGRVCVKPDDAPSIGMVRVDQHGWITLHVDQIECAVP